MKIINRLICALGVALTSALGVSSALAVEPPVRILPIGDSLTSGLSNNSVPGAYRNRLHLLLTTAGYNVDFVGTFSDVGNAGLPDVNHQGQGSARIDQIQTQIGGWLDAVDDPDVVLLMIGTNDFWQNYQLSTVQTRLTNLIADIATKRPFAKIIVSNLPLRTDNVGIEAQQALFNASIPGIVAQQVAQGRQVSYVDMHSAWSSGDLSPDGVHPTAIGFSKMGDTWFPAIANVISPKGTTNSPVIARAGPVTNLSEVPILFSKPVADTAVNLANFSVSGGLTINSAVLDAATKRTITLTTSTQTPGIVYSLSVTGVRDRTAAQTLIAPSSMVNFSSSALTNGSFENGLAGWNATGSVVIKSTSPYVATNGASAVAFNTDQAAPTGTLSQTFATVVGQSYQLTFDAGAFGFNTNDQRIRATVQGSTTLISDITTIKCPNGGATRWVSKTYNFTANSTTTTLTFADLSTTSNSLDLMLDNVKVGAQTTRTLAVTSTPVGGSAMSISPADISGNANGSTGLIRSYLDGASVTVTAPTQAGTNDFLRWQRNGVDLPGSTPAITVTLTSDITLNAVYGSNNSPVAFPDSYSTPANTPLTVAARGVLTNDSDPDGSTLTAVIDAQPTNGTVTLNANGSFVYTPNSGFLGIDSFSYHANDAVTDSNVVSVSLTVIASGSQLITNGSFESNMTSWTGTGNHQVQSAAPYSPTNGTRLLAFNQAQTTPNGLVTQSFPTVPGTTYQLAFDMGAFAYNTSSQRLQVTVQGSSSLLSQTLTVAGIGGGNTRWVSQSFSFTANSASTTLSFRDVSTTSNTIDLVLDNVRVTGAAVSRILTIESEPTSGFAIGVSPADRNSESGGNATFTRNYGEGTIVNLSAPATSGATAFVKWRKNGADFSTNRNISITIDAAMTMTAVYGTNVAPIAVNDSYPSIEEAPLIVPAPGVLTNDTDADSNPLIAVLATGPSNGTLTLNPNGGFTYTPNSGFIGTDTFTYRANDGSLNSAIGSVEISVAPVASGSIANGGFELGETGWTMTGNRIVVTSAPPYTGTEGTKVMVFNGAQTTPNAVISQAFNTTPGQTYVLELDAAALGAASTTQRLQVGIAGSSNLITQIETLTATSSTAPNWVAKSYTFIANSTSTTLTLSDVSTTGNLRDLLVDNVRLAGGTSRTLTVDASVPSVPITVSPADVSSQTNGTTLFTRLYPNGTEVTLTAPASHNGGAFIKWQKNSVDDATTPVTNVIVDANHAMTAVFAENTAPVAVGDAYTVEMESTLTVAANGVLGNDSDAESQPLTAAIVTQPANGAVTLNANGSFVYTPNSGFSGSDSFTYRANDGFLNSTPATVDITVNAFASGALVNGSFEDDETGWTITGSRLVASAAGAYTATDGTKMMVLNAGQVTTPNAVLFQTFATTVGKTYIVNLDMGIIAANNIQQRLRVLITGATERVNQLETITANAGSATSATWFPKTYSFVADSTSTTIGLADQSTDGRNRDLLVDNVRCAVRIDRTLTVNSTPDNGLNITVTPNDLNAEGNGATSFTRVYNNGVEVTLTAPAVSGAADFLKWTRNGVDYSSNATTTVTMNADFTMTAVYGVNTAPVAVGENYTTNQNTALTIPAAGVLTNDSDIDGTPLTAVLDVGPTSGTLDLNANGGFTYTPNNGFGGTDSFTYHASDGVLSSNVVTVNINVQTIANGTLVNGSFEQGATGWTISGNHFIINSLAPHTSTDELKLLVFNGAQSTPNGVASQSFATTPGETYTLQLDMGTVGTSGLQQRLQVSVQGSSSLVSQLETITGVGLNTVLWAPKTYTFVANSTSTTLTLTDSSTTSTNIDLLVDNVRVNSSSARTLIVTSAVGTGLAITASPADRAGNSNGVTPMHRFYSVGAEVTLTAPASLGGGNFLTWRKNGVDYSPNASTTVTMDANHTMTAVYASPPQLLVNGGFENDLTGWTPTGNMEVKAGSPYVSTEGAKLVAFNASQATPNGVLSQAFATIPGQTYELKFDAGHFGFTTGAQRIQVAVFGNSSLLSQIISITGLSGGQTRWLPQTFTFVANSNSTTLTFSDLSTSSDARDLVLDNVRISGFSVERTLTVTSTPNTGVNVTVTPADLGSNTDGTTQFTRTYNSGSTVNLTAPATHAGLPFSKWRKNGVDFSSTPATSVLIDGDHTLTAVYAANSAPVAVADTYSATVNTALTVPAPGVLGNDTDVDANTLTAAVVTNPTSGVLVLNSNGGFTYTPNTGFQGTDSFTYRANDGLANSNDATVTINVASVVPGVLVNGSFENNATGWTITGNHFIVPADSSYTATNGTKLLVANGGGLAPNAVISQSFGTTPGQTYVVDFDMGVIGPVNALQRLQITINGSSQLVSQLETMNAIGVGIARWLPKSYSFVANSSTTTLTFTDTSTVTDQVDLLLDNVRLGSGTARTLIFNTTHSSPVSVTVSPADLNGASSGSTTFNRSYNVGAVLNISAPATAGTASFIHWERNGTQFSTSASTTYTVNGNEYVTAVYGTSGGGGGGGGGNGNPVLTVNTTPNTGVNITVSPNDTTGAGNGSSNFTRNYPTGTVVSMVAPHANFVKWLKNGVWYATNPSITVTMDASTTMTAVYTSTPVLGPFTNGSFENEFTGWTWTGSQQSVKVKDGLPATNGLYVIEFNSNSSANDGAITQTFTTVPGTVYTVAFDMGVLAYNTATQRLQAMVFNGSTSLFSTTYSLAGQSGGKTVWSAKTFNFTATGTATTLIFRDQSTTGAGLDLLLDNVRVTSPNGPTARTLTVNSASAAGVPITISPVDTSSLGNGNTTLTRTYNNGTVVNLTAPSTASGVSFIKWQKNGVDVGTSTSTTVTMDANITMTAVYTPPATGTNLIYNGSFELSSPPSTWVGWSQSGSNRIEWPGAAYSTSGSKILSYSVGGTPPTGQVSQTFLTVPGTTYQLDFDLGALGGIAAEQRLLVTVTGNGTLLSQTPNIMGPSGLVMVWAHKTYTFVANSTTTTLTLADASAPAPGMDMFVDTISVVAIGSSSLSLTEEGESFSPQPVASALPDTEIAPNATEPATRLDSTPVITGTPGAYRIEMNATEAGTYILQRSADLQQWNFHSRIEANEPGPILFEDNESGQPRMFYRIGKETLDTGN